MRKLDSIIKEALIKEALVNEVFTKQYKSPQEFTLDWSTKKIKELLTKSGLKKVDEYWLPSHLVDAYGENGVFGFVYHKNAAPSNELSFMVRYKGHSFDVKWDTFLFLPTYNISNYKSTIELKDLDNQILIISRKEILDMLNNLNQVLLQIKKLGLSLQSF